MADGGRWPPLEVNARGHLVIGGCDTVELAATYGTPLYVYDEERIRERCRAYRRALEAAGGRAVYAGKAFLTLAMAALVAQEGLDLEVVSGGELYTA
ncbi:MAG: diaminopimelate decarboxylase, partial [Clostridia bacterium]|nr:diaminopimelate decarboxylase [Clostridia bacterium]